MYILFDTELRRLRAAAMSALPCEASGVLIRKESRRETILSLVVTASDRNTPRSFMIGRETIRNIQRTLIGSSSSVCGCFHTHILGTPWHSRRDRTEPKPTGDLWLIYSVRFREFELFEWDGNEFQRMRLRIRAKPAPCSAGYRQDRCGCRDCSRRGSAFAGHQTLSRTGSSQYRY
jgi:proteasome lid subunit RPN8/RPN11